MSRVSPGILRKNILEHIYRQQTCLICGTDFNMVGILGKNKILKSSCKSHIEPMSGNISSTEFIHTEESGLRGSCFVCNMDRSDGNQTRKVMIDYNHRKFTSSGCVSVCHIGKSWLFVNNNPTFHSETLLRSLFEKNKKNTVAGGHHRYHISNGKKEIILGDEFMDISGTLLVLPLFVFNHIMKKQKKFADPSRNWYNKNEFLVPYEEGDISMIEDSVPIQEMDIRGIYNHFTGDNDHDFLVSNKSIKYSSKQCPDTKMIIFDSPSRFVSEFISFHSGDTHGYKDITDLLPDETADNIQSITIENPYVRLTSGSLIYKVNLMGVYNSMLQTFDLPILPKNYLVNKISRSPYLSEIRKMIFPKIRYRKPSENLGITQTEREDAEEDIPLIKKKKRKSDTISENDTDTVDGMEVDVEEPKKKMRKKNSGKKPSDVLNSYIKEENNDETPVHSHFYRTLKNKDIIETPKMLSLASMKDSSLTDPSRLDYDILYTSNPKTMELNRLQTEIRNHGVVGPLDPSLGITPNGTFVSTVIPGIISESSRSSIREDTLTPAKMYRPINRVEKNSLDTFASDKYSGYIEKLRSMISRRQFGKELMDEMQTFMGNTFGSNKRHESSIYIKWDGVSRENIDHGFVPFVIFLNAEYSKLQ